MELSLAEITQKFEATSSLSKKESSLLLEHAIKKICSKELNTLTNNEKEVILFFYYTVIKFYIELNELDKALKISIDALDNFSYSPYILYLVSEIFEKQQKETFFLRNSEICLEYIKQKNYLELTKLDINNLVNNLKARITLLKPEYEKEYKIPDQEALIKRTPKEGLISACIMVKNEQDYIIDCINSLTGVVDEILVMDTGSTDNTVENAKKLGAKVFYYHWEDNFSKPRNKLFEFAQGEWLLIIDADEVLNKETAKNLRSILSNKELAAINLPIIDNSNNKMYFSTRIFLNTEAIYYQGIIHEQVTDSLLPYCEKNAKKITEADIEITHFGYSKENIARQQRHERNLNLIRKALKETASNTRGFIYYCIKLALELVNHEKMTIREKEEANDLFVYINNALEKGNYISDLTTFPPLISFGISYSSFLETDLKNKDAENVINFCLTHFPNDISLNMKKASQCINFRSYITAIEHLKKCLYLYYNKKFLSISSIDTNAMSVNIPLLLGIVYQNIGSFRVSEEWLLYGLKNKPEHQNLQRYYNYVRTKTSLDKISACMVIEENNSNIEETLIALLPLVHEIFVTVRGNISKEIKELSEKYKIRLYNLPKEDSFETSLNYALELALYNWILLLEPNEVIKNNKEDLKALIKDENKLAYYVASSTETKATYLKNCVRLFRNVPSLRYHQELGDIAYLEKVAFLKHQVIEKTNLIKFENINYEL